MPQNRSETSTRLLYASAAKQERQRHAMEAAQIVLLEDSECSHNTNRESRFTLQ